MIKVGVRVVERKYGLDIIVFEVPLYVARCVCVSLFVCVLVYVGLDGILCMQ